MTWRILLVTGFLPLIAFGSLFTTTCSDLDAMISWEEFLEEFRSEKSMIPELKVIKQYFSQEDSTLPRNLYVQVLKESFLHLDDQLEELTSHQDVRNLKLEVLDDIGEYVHLQTVREQFGLNDLYQDIFGGQLQYWLGSYTRSHDGLKPPHWTSEALLRETGNDL
jgi:hypothetical protein